MKISPESVIIVKDDSSSRYFQKITMFSGNLVLHDEMLASRLKWLRFVYPSNSINESICRKCAPLWIYSRCAKKVATLWKSSQENGGELYLNGRNGFRLMRDVSIEIWMFFLIKFLQKPMSDLKGKCKRKWTMKTAFKCCSFSDHDVHNVNFTWSPISNGIRTQMKEITFSEWESCSTNKCHSAGRIFTVDRH